MSPRALVTPISKPLKTLKVVVSAENTRKPSQLLRSHLTFPPPHTAHPRPCTDPMQKHARSSEHLQSDTGVRRLK